MNKDLKKIYITPKVETTIVELEQGIAAGSATVNNSVQEEWDKGEDDNRVLTW